MQNAVIFCLSINIIAIQSVIKAQNCLQSGNSSGLPSFSDYEHQNRIKRWRQAIIPSYKFVCDGLCGNITEWGVAVHSEGGNNHNVHVLYTLDLQVWRPSPTVDDSTGTGHYSLVGNNKYTSISLDSKKLAKLRVKPSFQDYIQFQPGDVLGFYVEEISHGAGGVVVLTSPSSFTSEMVWFASIAPTLATSRTTYSIGNSGELNTLTRAAPVISVETVTSCSRPSVVPTPPPKPTTLESPPSKTLETQQPTVRQETTASNQNSQSHNSNAVTTTGVGPGVPTISESISDQSITSRVDIGLIVGVVIVCIGLITVTSLVTVVVIALIKHGNKRKYLANSIPNGTCGPNQAHNEHGKEKEDEHVYSCPTVVLDKGIQTKSNGAYATNISTEGNNAYGSNMVIQENRVPVQAYAIRNIVTTEKHSMDENKLEESTY